MDLPSPDATKAALAIGSGFAVGYLIRQGMADSADMSDSDRRKLSIGFVMLAGGALVYHLMGDSKWNVPSF